MEQQPVTRDKKQRQAPEPTLIGKLETGDGILQDLLRTHHPELASAKILLLSTNKEITSGGRERAGKVQKSTPLLSYLTSDREGNGADIIITVSQGKWNDADLRGRQVILDHLLTCVEAIEDETTGDYKYKVTSPHVAVFPELVERYGVYDDSVRDLANVLSHTPAAVPPVVR